MCDSFVATPEATSSGRMLFAKNSDREPTEAQAVERILGASHPEGALARCTWIDVPQVSRTRTVLIARPYWMWGAEMGVNDAGVAIGNEAVFTRAPLAESGLTGMDLVRLALERSSGARRAVELIGELLETHGQGGAAGQRSSFRYHNSFLVADGGEAWVMETAARAWVAKRVSGVRSISNGLTLRNDWDIASASLAARARDHGLSPGRGKLDFAGVFGRKLITLAAAAARRRSCTEAFLARDRGRIDASTCMRALRQHGAPDRPARALGALRLTVCAHASALPTRVHGQTTGSLVAELGDPLRVFVTATSAPCLSSFKPASPNEALPDIGTPGARYDASSVWWRHERLHRLALRDLDAALACIAPKRDLFEREVLEGRIHAAEAFARARALASGFETELRERFRALPGLGGYWRAIDREVGLPGLENSSATR